MTVVAGPLFAAAGLLAAAGAAKVARPASTVDALRAAELPGSRSGRSPALDRLWVGRLIGMTEIAVACTALALGGRTAGALIAVVYLAFALFTARLLQRAGAGASCGCFGAEQTPAAPVHVVVNGAIAVTAALAVAWPTAGLVEVLRHQPLGGVPFLGLCAVLGWLLFATLTVVPELQSAMADTSTESRRSAARR